MMGKVRPFATKYPYVLGFSLPTHLSSVLSQPHVSPVDLQARAGLGQQVASWLNSGDTPRRPVGLHSGAGAALGEDQHLSVAKAEQPARLGAESNVQI